MAWVIGRKLQGGKYTIKEELGLGGFGITYLAMDNNQQKVVIKTLNFMLCANPQGNFRLEVIIYSNSIV